jgi:MFS transporter, DHA1 family, multidrug resistance protein
MISNYDIIFQSYFNKFFAEGIAWVALIIALPETNKNLNTLKFKKITTDYHKLLSSKQFMSASIVPSLLYAGYIAFVVCSSFLYINTFGLSMIYYTLHLVFIVGVFAIVSLYANKITTAIGTKKTMIGSLVIIVTSISIMMGTSHIAPRAAYLITLSMSLYCIGSAVLYPIIFSQSLEIFPEIKGTASSTIMSMRTLLMAALTGFTGLMYNGTAMSVALILALTVVVIVILTGYILRRG